MGFLRDVAASLAANLLFWLLVQLRILLDELPAQPPITEMSI